MFNLFSKNKWGAIGLDVGADGVKMLQLTNCGGKLAVLAGARQRVPNAAAETATDAHARRNFAVQAVRDMLGSGQFRGRDVVSCLRADELVIKNVRLPHMPEPELASAVQWECRERFGFEVAPDRVHFINAGEVRQGEEVQDEVILMAAPEEEVRAHLEMLDQMRLNPLHIDAEPLALFRTYQRFLRRAADESSVSVIVDIGLASTKVIVARGATTIFVKSIDVNGRKLNEGVAKELSLSYPEACHFRRRLAEQRLQEGTERVTKASPDDAPETHDQVEWSVLDAIRGPVEALAREISLCLRYCSVTFRGLRPVSITLTGGEAYGPALVKLLNECLDFECVVGEPLQRIDMGSISLGSDRRGTLTEWSVATGLALRGLVYGENARTGGDEGSRLSA
jgi:type IV pilus assembly protein PilM